MPSALSTGRWLRKEAEAGPSWSASIEKPLPSAEQRSNGRTKMLSKIQLIKFNLMVSVDCAPTSASRFRYSSEL
jgi:hypothetical protein